MSYGIFRLFGEEALPSGSESLQDGVETEAGSRFRNYTALFSLYGTAGNSMVFYVVYMNETIKGEGKSLFDQAQLIEPVCLYCIYGFKSMQI
ncbi:MAG: hypothetical protein JXA79_01670 [Deltaproteobacteria bacterium]|nr:hypothetical protein [Deltaproteobacteria bacterium]